MVGWAINKLSWYIATYVAFDNAANLKTEKLKIKDPTYVLQNLWPPQRDMYCLWKFKQIIPDSSFPDLI